MLFLGLMLVLLLILALFLLLLLLLLLLLSPLGVFAVLAAAVVAVNSTPIEDTAINVMDAVNVEVVAMMVFDGEGCVRRLDAKL